MSHNVHVSALEEGNEILTHSSTGETQIVEQVTTTEGKTTVLLIDGRSLTVPEKQLVTVFS